MTGTGGGGMAMLKPGIAGGWVVGRLVMLAGGCPNAGGLSNEIAAAAVGAADDGAAEVAPPRRAVKGEAFAASAVDVGACAVGRKLGAVGTAAGAAAVGAAPNNGVVEAEAVAGAGAFGGWPNWKTPEALASKG